MLQRFLLYLLLLLLPIQLGRHFFFDFSKIAGIRSDYLAPTIYLTDFIILLMIAAESVFSLRSLVFCLKNNKRIKFYKPAKLLLLVICYLLFINLFVAKNPWVSWYKTIKITEFILLGFIIVKLKPKIFNLLIPLSIAIIYSSIIALWQFLLQRSIGGLFWYLGERTFYSSSPGIAAFSWQGKLILRPYSIFPHPNVLAGFLALVLPIILIELIFYRRQLTPVLILLFVSASLLGILALILTFSRFAWFVFLLGLVLAICLRKKKMMHYLKKKEKPILFLFYFSIVMSVVFPLVFSINQQSVNERRSLIEASLNMTSQNPMFGVGLNNFIVSSRQYLISLNELYIYQPVHNIYLLVFAETGIIGFFLFCLFITAAIRKSLYSAPVFLVLAQVLLLGLFDHYFVTLQQGQLLFTVFVSLAFLGRNSYTKLR